MNTQQSADPRFVSLAHEMLAALRSRKLAQLKRMTRGDIDLSTLAEMETTPLSVERAAHAVRLAHCLSPHFASMEELVGSKAFILIETGAATPSVVLADVLGDAVLQIARRVATNPVHGIEHEEKFLVLYSSDPRPSSSASIALAEAARRGLTAVCLVEHLSFPPASIVTGADLSLTLPPYDQTSLELIFQACLSVNDPGLVPLADVEWLQTDDLVAHIRPGRTPSECLDKLAVAISARRPQPVTARSTLEHASGYGKARTWGLELAQDLELWRQGKLSWEEIDHRAVVLHGPPGTGKTSFAGLLAGTLEVPLTVTSVAEWNSHEYLSGTLRRMNQVFKEAQEKAPGVMLIDELDGISSRASVEGRYAEYWIQLVNRLLELVTQTQAVEGLVIIGATNHLDRIDPALLRAGRLDHVIKLDPPDQQALAQILKSYAGPQFKTKELLPLAARLVGKTGADVEKLVRGARAAARRSGRIFSVLDLELALPDPLAGLAPPMRRRVGVYRAGQRIVAEVLGLQEQSAAEESLGADLARKFREERFATEQDGNDLLAVLMGGRAAEEIVFGDVSVLGGGHAESDLALATELAGYMEFRSGWGELGTIYIDSKAAANPASISAARRRIDAALARASALLLDNRDEIERREQAEQSMHVVGLPRPRMLN